MVKKIEISNCWSFETIEYDGRPIYEIEKEYANVVFLKNGDWLVSCGDGRYHLDGDDTKLYAAVFNNEYDENGEYNQGYLLGFCEVWF